MCASHGAKNGSGGTGIERRPRVITRHRYACVTMVLPGVFGQIGGTLAGR
jgi:hypothetical protein